MSKDVKNLTKDALEELEKNQKEGNKEEKKS